MGYIPRWYQNQAVEKGLRALRGKSNDVIVAPCGSGKSLIISMLAQELNEPTLILQPSKEILKQNYEKLLSYGVNDVAMYSASVKKKEIDKFTYATIGSIYTKPELFKHFNYVLIDEAHLYNAKNKDAMYNSFFRAIGNPKVLGLTASPYRMVQKYYKDGEDMYYTSMLQVLNRIHPFFFKKFCYNIQIDQLFKEGWLCPIEYISHKDTNIDISKIKENTTGADFDETALENYMMSAENVEKVISAIVEHDTIIKRNLIFCSSRLHAKRVSEKLCSLGYTSELITSEMTDKEKETITKNFTTGITKHVCAVGMWTTGVDMPWLDTVTMARPTMSLGLWYQMCARAIRIDPNNPNKKAKIIDTTNNMERLGRIETIRIEKEEDGFRDKIVTERGTISGVPLYTFKMTNQDKISEISKHMN